MRENYYIPIHSLKNRRESDVKMRAFPVCFQENAWLELSWSMCTTKQQWHHSCTLDAHSLFSRCFWQHSIYVTTFTRTHLSRDWWRAALSGEISNVLKNSKFDDLSVMVLLTTKFIHGDLESRTLQLKQKSDFRKLKR